MTLRSLKESKVWFSYLLYLLYLIYAILITKIPNIQDIHNFLQELYIHLFGLKISIYLVSLALGKLKILELQLL